MNLKSLLRGLALGAALLFTTAGQAQTSLISTNTAWRYLDDGSDQGTAWRSAGFNDSGWSNGVPLFGAESPGIYPWPIRTPMPVGGGRVTYYFRTHFARPEPWSSNDTLRVSGYFDDGAVFYLNSVEAGRVRMADPVAFNSFASAASSEGVLDTLPLSAAGLVAGDNVLAVEVHQVTLASSDILFGMTLTGTNAPPPDTTPPTVASVSPPPGGTVTELTRIEVEFSEPVTGVDAADLRISDAPATGVSPISAARYAFTFPAPPEGPVMVAWAPGHGIADLAHPPNDFAGGPWNYTLNPPPPRPRLFINEWLADNRNGIVDPEDGQHDDWFEIYNPGTNAASLDGLYLTDWNSNDFRFAIPPGLEIPAGGYLRVWADGQPAQTTPTSLHVTFTLAKGGENIGLYAADGTVIDAIIYGPQTSDVSEGRFPDGATNRYFMVPTPGAANVLGPVLTCPGNKTVEYGSAWTFDNPTATGGCGGTDATITIVSTVTNGGCPIIATRTWQATDACANSAVCSQTVTVAGATPPAIVTQPASATVADCSSVTFAVGAFGNGSFTYAWSANGVPIPGADGPAYTKSPVTLADAGTVFTVTILNECGSVISAPAVLNVIGDAEPPALVSASAPCDSSEVTVTFSERLDELSATNSLHYQISGGLVVQSAVLAKDGQTVSLFTEPLTPGVGYTLAVDGVRDLCGQAIAANSQLTFQCSPPPAPAVFINEWLAGNTNDIVDPTDGQHDDWFELYNPGRNAVDLAGHFLTDSLTNKFKFPIPAGYSIPPGGYLLVWADASPAANSTNFSDLHVNFTLPGTGGELGLFAADGTALDAISFGAQTADVSEGRWPDGGTNRYFMTQTSALAPNAPSVGSAGSCSSKGTSFWLAIPGSTAGANKTLVLLIAGCAGTSGNVGIPGLGFLKNFTIPLSGGSVSIDLPISAEITSCNLVENKGIHVTANNPVSVYGGNRHTNSTDGYLGLPENALGTTYMVLAYGGSQQFYASELTIVACQNGTTVTITPSITACSHPAGVSYTVSLTAGQTYQLKGTTDVTGTKVTANKPIAVFGGHECANVPDGINLCDHLVEQLPPVTTWGREFFTIPLATRVNGDAVRVLASVNGTKVFVNGTLAITLNSGQFVEGVVNGPTRITANFPVLVAQYATGTRWDNNRKADPFMMLVPATKQFVKDYCFTTGPAGYANYLNLIVPAADVGLILYDGFTIPSGLFVPLGSSGFWATRGVVPAGYHRLTGPAPFGVSVYGWPVNEFYESYGYPADLCLEPNPLPGIVVQPQSRSVPAGGSVTLTAAATDFEPVSYQWQFNGTNIFGATNATLTVSNVYSANSGAYTVVATSLAGTNTVEFTAHTEFLALFPPTPVATLDAEGVLTVLGTDLDDDIEIRLKAGDPNILEVDNLKNGSGADFSFPVASIRQLFVDVAAGNDRVVCSDANGFVASGSFAGEVQLGDGDDTFIGSTAIMNMAALTNMMALNQVVSNLYAGAEILRAYAQSNLVEPGSNVMAGVISEVLDPAAALLDEVYGAVQASTATNSADFPGQLETTIEMMADAFRVRAEEIAVTRANNLADRVAAIRERAAELESMADALANQVEAFAASLEITPAAGGPPLLMAAGGNPHPACTCNTPLTGWFAWGGAGDDLLVGSGANDWLFGGPGNDLLLGFNGNDLLDGGLGKDILLGGRGDDCLYGDDGNDWLSGGPGNDRIEGGLGDDFEFGGTGDDCMYGDAPLFPFLGGIDFMFGGAGSEYMEGNHLTDFMFGQGDSDTMHGDGGSFIFSFGDDFMFGGGARDFMYGNFRNDWIFGDGGDDVIEGNLGNDVIDGGPGDDTLDGHAGSDFILGRGDRDTISGGDHSDLLMGGDDKDVIDGGTFADVISGGSGDDDLHGGIWNDLILGNEGNDTIHGDDGFDLIMGNDGDDVCYGDDGFDLILGNRGNDCLYGGDGNDVIVGDFPWEVSGNDCLDGGDGWDQLLGGPGDDNILGRGGNDVLFGGAGGDILDGGPGNDAMFGGPGSDDGYGGGGINSFISCVPHTGSSGLDCPCNASGGGGTNPAIYSICGVKWCDKNANGVRDSDENHLLSGVTIYLDLNGNGVLDIGEPTAVTAFDNPNTTEDETGTYCFTKLAAGTYCVREIVPAPMTQTYPAAGACHVVTVGPESVAGVDFGNACGPIIPSPDGLRNHEFCGVGGGPPPVLLSASGSGTKITLTFNALLDPTCVLYPSQYVVTPGITVTAVSFGANGQTLCLTVTPALVFGQPYHVKVLSVCDVCANAGSAEKDVTVQSFLGPIVTITRDGSALLVQASAPGELQQAASVDGPWRDVPHSNNGLRLNPTNSARFFRLRQ